MNNDDKKPKKKTETSGAGPGGRKRTAVGTGDGGDGEGPRGQPESSGYLMFMTNPRVVFCERHELLRAGMKAMIPFCKVIGESAEGPQALGLVKHLKPDLLITEMDIDGFDGLELCRRVHESSPNTVFLISTNSFYATKFHHRMMRDGVSGIYLKRSGRFEFILAIVEVLNGWHYCNEVILKLIRQHPPQIDSLNEALTPNEIDVLTRLNLSNEEIGDELRLELPAVETLLLSVMKKLNVASRQYAAETAIKLGFTLLPCIPSRNTSTGATEEEDLACAHAEAALRDSRLGII